MKQVDDSFLLGEKKDKTWKFIMKTLMPKPRRVLENIPWINQPMLDWSVQVIWSSWGVWSKALEFSKASWSWTWAVNLTWFWFQPNWYTITAWRDGWSTGTNMSFSSYIRWNITWYYIDTTLKNLSSRVVCVYGSWNTRANHSAFLSDGIQLYFISDTIWINYIVTAYK